MHTDECLRKNFPCIIIMEYHGSATENRVMFGQAGSGMKYKKPDIGILDDTYGSLGGGQLVVAHLAAALAPGYLVEVIHTDTAYNLKTLTKLFAVDLTGVSERIVPLKRNPWFSFGLPGIEATRKEVFTEARNLTRRYDLFIYCGHGVPPFCFARHGLIYCHFPFQRPPLAEAQGAPGWSRRRMLDRFFRRSAYQLLWDIRMQRYGTILANSAYTAGWIGRRWKRDSKVVFPPVELSVPTVDKKKLIVSVGRFWGQNVGRKNQYEQVTAFRKFWDDCGREWQLCLAGSCCSEPDRTYLAAVQKAAEGLPVRFLVNAQRESVCEALAEAKIFWHTMGLSVDETEHPEAVEHFGIATVEAMRTGCVPIVIASGGQREIIRNDISGYLCSNLDELLERTIRVARDDRLYMRMSSEARKGSMAFTRAVFDKRITEIVSERLGRSRRRSVQMCSDERNSLADADPTRHATSSDRE